MKRFSRQVLQDKEAPVAALVVAALDTFGIQCLMWESGILRDEIKQELNLEITDLQHDRLQAGITVLTSNVYQDDPSAFLLLSKLFNNQPVDHENPVAEITAEEFAVALANFDILEPENDFPFSDDVKRVIGQIFHEYGLSDAATIYPSALMPAKTGEKVGEIEQEKNEALTEIYNTVKQGIKAYLETQTD